VERLGAGQPQRFLAASGDAHAVALAGQGLGQELARDLIVVDDQEHRRGGGHASVLRAGRQTRNVAPLPSSLSTSIRPLCSRTISAVMKRPRPVPWPASLVEKNGSEMCLRSGAEMAWAVSAVAISTSVRAGRPAGVLVTL